MSYDLAVWEGPQPASAEAADETYDTIMDRLDGDGADEEPTPAIRAYVDALLARWPDLDDDNEDEVPWADGPLLGNAFGNAIYFALVYSRADEAADYAARLAAEQGLVCYDPQAGAVWSPPAD